MQSRATTVAAYLAELPADRRATIAAIRQVILANVDENIEEGMQYGMIGYYVPHRVYPAGYHCDPRQPLPYACLASQKNYLSLYMMLSYGAGEEEQWLRKAWEQAGKKINMGKCCIRFKRLEDVPLEVLAEAIRRVPTREHIARYEAVLASQRARKKPASSGGTRPKKSKPPSATPRAATARSAAKSRPARPSAKKNARPGVKQKKPASAKKK